MMLSELVDQARGATKNCRLRSATPYCEVSCGRTCKATVPASIRLPLGRSHTSGLRKSSLLLESGFWLAAELHHSCTGAGDSTAPAWSFDLETDEMQDGLGQLT